MVDATRKSAKYVKTLRKVRKNCSKIWPYLLTYSIFVSTFVCLSACLAACLPVCWYYYSAQREKGGFSTKVLNLFEAAKTRQILKIVNDFLFTMFSPRHCFANNIVAGNSSRQQRSLRFNLLRLSFLGLIWKRIALPEATLILKCLCLNLHVARSVLIQSGLKRGHT